MELGPCPSAALWKYKEVVVTPRHFGTRFTRGAASMQFSKRDLQFHAGSRCLCVSGRTQRQEDIALAQLVYVRSCLLCAAGASVLFSQIFMEFLSPFFLCRTKKALVHAAGTRSSMDVALDKRCPLSAQRCWRLSSFSQIVTLILPLGIFRFLPSGSPPHFLFEFFSFSFPD